MGVHLLCPGKLKIQRALTAEERASLLDVTSSAGLPRLFLLLCVCALMIDVFHCWS